MTYEYNHEVKRLKSERDLVMRKVMIATMMLTFALLASAEPVKITLQDGDQGRKLYYSHPECQVNLSCDEFLAEAAPANGFENTDENWKKIRAGQEFILPVEKPEPITETKEITEDAPDGGSGIDDGRNGTDTDVVATGGRIDLREAGLEPYSLEGLLGQEGPKAEQPAAAQSPNVESREAEAIIVALEEENLTLKSEVDRYRKMIQNSEWIEARVLKTQEAKIQDLTYENERLERELADKSKAGAIAPGNNGSSPSSSDYFIPIISVSTAYAIGSVGVIILLTIIVIWSLIKVSQLKGDRSRLIKELNDKQEQLDQKSTEHTYMQSEVVKQRRIINTQTRLMKPHYHAFLFPGAIKKATKEPIPDGLIYLPIKDRDESGLALVEISGLSKLTPAKFPLIEGALRSEDHQRQNDAYLLPPRSAEDRTRRQDVLRLPTPHKKQVANAS